MIIEVLKSKLHRATVTEAKLHYEGSITIDLDLMEHINLVQYEKVLIVNINNGQRFETYVIKGERGSGTICLNGAAARLAQIGDKVIIMSFAKWETEKLKPNYKPIKITILDDKNKEFQ